MNDNTNDNDYNNNNNNNNNNNSTTIKPTIKPTKNCGGKEIPWISLPLLLSLLSGWLRIDH